MRSWAGATLCLDFMSQNVSFLSLKTCPVNLDSTYVRVQSNVGPNCATHPVVSSIIMTWVGKGSVRLKIHAQDYNNSQARTMAGRRAEEGGGGRGGVGGGSLSVSHPVHFRPRSDIPYPVNSNCKS